MGNALPDLTSKIKIDTSDLTRAAQQAGVDTALIGKGFDGAGMSSQRFTQAVKQHAAALQTSIPYTVSYGAALTKQEEKYASLQLGELEAKKGLSAIAEESAKTAGAFGTLGGKGSGLLSQLGAMAGQFEANSGGLSKLNIGLAAGAVGVGVLATGLAAAEERYISLGESVLNFKRVTGASAEQSSQLVEVFRTLGINSDEAAGAMFRMERQIESSKGQFSKLGISVATDSKGNVDFSRTLLNVADAYASTTDQGRKSQIVIDAFGRSGMALIPVLERGRAGIQALMDSSHDIFSEQDLQNVERYRIANEQLKQSEDELSIVLGQRMTPALANAASNTANFIDRIARGKTQFSDFSNALLLAQDPINALKDGWSLLTGATDKGKDSLSGSAAALEQQTQAASDAEKAAQGMYDAQTKLDQQTLTYSKDQEAVAGLTDDYTKKQLSLSRAQLDVTDKATALKSAIDKYGSRSEEAKKATLDFRDAQLALRDASRQLQGALTDQEGTILSQALAYVDMQKQLAGVYGGTLNAAGQQQAFHDALENVRKELDPSNPLYKSLTAYIDELENVPPKVTTQLALTVSTTLASAKQQALSQAAARQFGGPVQPNRDYIVGEKGPELLRLGAQGGQVYPAGSPQTQSALHGGATINATFNAAGMSAWDVQRELAWMLKYGLR